MEHWQVFVAHFRTAEKTTTKPLCMRHYQNYEDQFRASYFNGKRSNFAQH